MKNHLIRLTLYAFMAMVPISCGSRKVSTVISEHKQEVKQEAETKADVKKEEVKKEVIQEKQKVDKKEEKQEQRTTELYFDNGLLKSRVIENLNSKSTDNSTSIKTSVTVAKIQVDSVFTDRHYNSIKISDFDKKKYTQTSNTQVYWMLFGLGVISIVAVFVYKWLNNKIKAS
jgi:hypothetical protein